MDEVEEKKWCVYMHRNKVNNKVYIGIANQKPKYRWEYRESLLIENSMIGR